MVSVPLNIPPFPCANITSSFTNECCQTFLCLLSLIGYLYSIASHAAVYIMEFATSWNEKDLPSKIYWPSVTSRPTNRCVHYISINFPRMSIYSGEVIFDLFAMALYLLVQAYVNVGAGVWYVPTIGDGALIIRSTLGGAFVFTLVGDAYLTFSSTLGGAPGLSRQD